MWILKCCSGRFLLVCIILTQLLRPAEGQFGEDAFDFTGPPESDSPVTDPQETEVADVVIAGGTTDVDINVTDPPRNGTFTLITNPPNLPEETKPPSLAPVNETKAPSTPETSAPTLSNRIPATLATVTSTPTLAPIVVSVVSETMAPTVSATVAPVTAAPTVPATVAPVTSAPTVSVAQVTAAPTVSATVAPVTASPTVPATVAPVTVAPTTLPPVTAAPETSTPTISTAAPTAVPTTTAPTTAAPVTPSPTEPIEEPVEPTEPPTESAETEEPETPETEAPIDPTLPPTVPIRAGIASELQMTLEGVAEEFSPSSERNWIQWTELHVQDYFANTNDVGVTDVNATITVMNQQVVAASGRRFLREDSSRLLQASSLIVTYNQAANYRVSGDNIDAIYIATQPFESANSRASYVESLRTSGDESFISLTGAAVTDAESAGPDPVEELPDTDAPTDAPAGGLSTGALAGIIAGSGVVIILIAGASFFRAQNSTDESAPGSTKVPPSQLDVGSGGGEGEEISRLDEPHQAKVAAPTSNESLPGYGDQSVATVDYDYSKAYGGGGDTSVSSAGGTFGSNTHAQSAGGAAVESTAGGPLDTSFSESGSQHRGQSQNVKEELIDIYAPPGKLGVVIDTPDDGAPVVHAVKDSSVIADKLQVGDKLVAVDDEDVRSMTAIKVSKLISRKSTNPTRKLTIIRTVVVDE